MRNQAPIDIWTPVHVGAGVAFGLAGASFGAALAMAIGYEVAEQLIERSEAGQRFFGTSAPESATNVLSDLVFFTGGYVVARQVAVKLAAPARVPRVHSDHGS